MILELITSVIGGFLIGIIPTYLYFRRKLEVQKLKVDQQDKELEIQKSKMQQQEAYHQKEIENAKNNEMTVVTYPYIEECGEGGWVFDSRTAEVGYKYQLFIKGVPCFEPHKIILQKLTKKEVVQSKIDALFKQAINAIESIASMHPAFAVVKSAPAILGKTIANKLTTKPVQQARRTKLRSNAKR